jgi:hypothetical protein
MAGYGRSGLSHLAEDGSGEGVGPSGALAFAADRDVWSGRAQDIEREAPTNVPTSAHLACRRSAIAMISLQPTTSWNLYGLAPNRGYTQVNKNEGIREGAARFAAK